MQKITGLKLQKRNKQRVNVYLDNKFGFGLSRIVAAWLHVGHDLSAVKIDELKKQDEQEVAFQRALNLLNYRPRSEAEIQQKLRRNKVPETVVSHVLERLRETKLVDDRAFAYTWVENRSEFRPRGRRALRIELRQKGIGAEVIEDVLESLDEESLAYQAALKKAAKLNITDVFEFKRKLYGFLSRRGFDYETASSAVQKILGEQTTLNCEDLI